MKKKRMTVCWGGSAQAKGRIARRLGVLGGGQQVCVWRRWAGLLLLAHSFVKDVHR